MVLTVSVKGFRNIERRLEGLQIKLPEALDKDSRKVMNSYKMGLKKSLMVSGFGGSPLSDTGALSSSIRYHKVSKGVYEMTMPEYGEWIDRMVDHKVSTDRPEISRWLARKGIDNYGPVITVHRHPWIDNGLNYGRQRISSDIANGATIKHIRKFGRLGGV